MGEYADMMLDGSHCVACGVYIGDAVDFPQYCSKRCERERGVVDNSRDDLPKQKQGQSMIDQIMDLKKNGFTHMEIAKTFGVSKSSIARRVQNHRKKLARGKPPNE